MTLRTPRRRISPQTRRRCKAIKGFFKRAIGSLSQPDLLQITSSIAVNVTDINHKIVGLEKQLQEVCRTCSENPHEIHSVRPKSPTLTKSRHAMVQREISSGIVLKGKDTTTIYAKSENQFNSSDPSDYAIGTNDEINIVKSKNRMKTGIDDERVNLLKKKKSKVNNRGNDYDVDYQKLNSISTNFVSTYSTSSFHSLDEFRKMYYTTPGLSDNIAEKRKLIKAQNKNKTHRKTSPKRCDKQAENVAKNRKSRHNVEELDQDFIADIIRRQYKPVKFGRRSSDLSQFSVPVCRDHEFCLPTNNCYNIPEKHPLCNCGTCYSDFSDIRTVCDARLYNLTQNARSKDRRRHLDAYDNSDVYDLVPVKEKSSPKTRRKFFEDNMRSAYYKEVPPSPKTHRPQLNLKVRRYAESDCNLNSGKKMSPKHSTRCRKMEENYNRSVNRNSTISPKNTRLCNKEFEENYDPRENQRKTKNNNLKQEDKLVANSTISGNYPASATEDPAASNETPFNKTQETAATDKTDQALCEIKDILQSFLLEIKKEASSHNQKLNVSTEMIESGNSPLNNTNITASTRRSFPDFNSAPCPVPPLSPYMPALPPFGNTCCYPLMPMCPINCMQNSCTMPSTSSNQNNYVDKSDKACNSKSSTNKMSASETCETDELIKKIYKFVSQSPTNRTLRTRKSSCSSDSKQEFHIDDKALTSRSVGGSTLYCRHDAKVGTPKMHCVSKSCEAIKLPSENSDINVSYSDTVLDKLSFEATQSTSDTESSTEVSEVKISKFLKVLQSLGLASKKTRQEDSKKFKKDVIEELSESESTIVEEKEVKKKPPFRQNITNYAMHSQKYCSPPPISPHYYPGYPEENRPPYTHDFPYWDPRLHHSNKYGPPQPQYRRRDFSTGPPYSQSYESYNPMQPQVPLCLKEVEVKSIGCQSERKFSFFRKMTQKMQQPSGSSQGDSYQRNCSTQTLQMKNEKPQNKSGMFNWKNPPTNFMDGQLNPKMFRFQTQKKLAMGDMKMRNAMLKKMFYKRNPFSPRNLIVRTLMGKDKSSFGDPPKMNFRPRLFV